MTQEEKQLLLKDLCARLPYSVKVSITAHNLDYEKDFGKTIIADLTGIHTSKDDGIIHTCLITCYDEFKTQGNDIDTIKPYLRSMSSMTEEELKELNEKYGNIAYFFIQKSPYYHGLQAQHSDIGSIEISEFSEIYDWLNAHHFDYRELIPMGLALEAPGEMYKID